MDGGGASVDDDGDGGAKSVEYRRIQSRDNRNRKKSSSGEALTIIMHRISVPGMEWGLVSLSHCENTRHFFGVSHLASCFFWENARIFLFLSSQNCSNSTRKGLFC